MNHIFRLLAGLLLMASPVVAQPLETITLPGHALTGPDARDVRFEFFCSSSGRDMTGALAVNLHVPRHGELRARFDFDRFEGPDANAGRLTRLTTPAGVGNFGVGGWIGVAADQNFVFGINAARRGDAQRLAELARLLRPLTVGPAHLTWTQGQPRRGGVPLVATLEVSAGDSARLNRLLAPCLAAR